MALRQDSKVDHGSGGHADGDPEVVTSDKGTGVTAVMIAVGVLAVLFIVFLAQSTERIAVEFLVWETDTPLYVVLLSTMATTALATLAVAGVWRRRRRRYRTEHEELERLRARNR